MALIGNVLWFIAAGWFTALCWLAAALVACISVVLFPLAPACIRLALFSAAPFGRELIDKRILDGRQSDIATQTSRAGLNMLWVVLVGWWLSSLMLAYGVLLCLLLITIPFGLQAFKLAGAARCAWKAAPSPKWILASRYLAMWAVGAIGTTNAETTLP